MNGITYSVSPSILSNRGGFEENETVYYNPNNPSESIMYACWSTITIIGVIIIIVVIVIFVFKNIFMEKLSKGKDNITMNVYKTN